MTDRYSSADQFSSTNQQNDRRETTKTRSLTHRPRGGCLCRRPTWNPSFTMSEMLHFRAIIVGLW